MAITSVRVGKDAAPMDSQQSLNEANEEWERWISYPSQSEHSPHASVNRGADHAPRADRSDTQAVRPAGRTYDFLPASEWNDEKDYTEAPLLWVHYTMMWKVSVNNRAVSQDTEQGIPIAPSVFWRLSLKVRLDALASTKCAGADSVDTSVKVSVNDRREQDLLKTFDKTSVNWAQIEKQLLAWGELIQAGKKLTVSMTFNYRTTQSSLVRSRDKRSRPSATNRMLAERSVQIDAEEDSSGQPSAWRYVYKLMRCSGPPCHLGPHCWVDPDGRKHFRLKPHHMKALIRHVEGGGTLESHDDVPQTFREQVYAEEQHLSERQRKKTKVSSDIPPPINIHVVQPQQNEGPLRQQSGATLPTPTPSVTMSTIPDCRDDLMDEYCLWQQSRYSNTALKDEFRKAFNVALMEGVCLKQIYRERNVKFFIELGVKKGIAWSFVYDIDEWVKKKTHCKNVSIESNGQEIHTNSPRTLSDVQYRSQQSAQG